LQTTNLYHPHAELYSTKWAGLLRPFGVPLAIDRTNVAKDMGFNYSVSSPIPEDPHTDSTFAGLCDITAKQIFNRAKKPILIMYSGGIDSTTVLSSFIKLGIEVVVGYTDSSIGEYPWLYAKIKKGTWPNVRLVYIAKKSARELQDDFHIVTGVVGDQIAGSVKQFMGSEGNVNGIRLRQFDHWKDVMPPYIVEGMENSVNAFPVRINLYADFLWWVNFNFKYQWVCLGFINRPGMDTTLVNTYSHFFDTLEFQRWSMTNSDIRNDFVKLNQPLKYKLVFKEYILSVLHDEDYYYSKGKVRSMSEDTFSILSNHNLMIENVDNKMNVLTLNEYKEKTDGL